VAIRGRSYAGAIETLDGLDPGDPDHDLERLARLLFGLAGELLRRRGRFFPFGGVIWAEGGAEQLVAAPPNQASAKDPGGLLDSLVAELATEASAGRLRAAGTCVDVRQDPDLGLALRADLESADGCARAVLFGYERRFPRRFLIAATPVDRPGVARIFPPSMDIAGS